MWCHIYGIWSFVGSICFYFAGKVVKNLEWDFSKDRRKCCINFSLRGHSRESFSEGKLLHSHSEKTGSSKWWELKNKKIGRKLQSCRGGLDRVSGWIQWKLVISRAIMEEDKDFSYILWVSPIDYPCKFCSYVIRSYPYYMTDKFKY